MFEAAGTTTWHHFEKPPPGSERVELSLAVLKHPKRNLALRHGARIIKRHEGEPRPEPPRDPNLKEWSVRLIGGSKARFLGYVEAVTEPAAIEAAVVLFGIDAERRKRLAVNPRR